MTGESLEQAQVTLFTFYSKLTSEKKNKALLRSPLLLLIDPTMQNNQLSIKVLSLVTNRQKITVFAECPFSFELAEFEQTGLDIIFFGQNHFDTMAILQQRKGKEIAQDQIGNLMET